MPIITAMAAVITAAANLCSSLGVPFKYFSRNIANSSNNMLWSTGLAAGIWFGLNTSSTKLLKVSAYFSVYICRVLSVRPRSGIGYSVMG